MNAVPPSEGDSRGFQPFIELLRATAVSYIRHFWTLALIVLVRLVPFYVFLWFFPVEDQTMDAIVETLVVVPCVAALVRFAQAELHGIALTPFDALLGASPGDTLKLLGTDLLIVLVAIFFAAGGPIFFAALVFVWSWATLVTDQVVIIEGQLLFGAIRRSMALVRTSWRLSLAATLLLSVIDAAWLTAYWTMPPTLQREVITRGITLVTTPFTTLYLTRLYLQYLAPTANEAAS